MRFILSLTLFLSFFSLSFGIGVKNIDKPLNGRWDLKMRKIWELNETGNTIFTVIDDLKAANDDTLYLLDRKLYRIFIISKDGRYLSSFGTKGDGPGEFSTLRGLFLVGESLIVVDNKNIHYYSKKGKYMKSILNTYVVLSPLYFVALSKFISAPVFYNSKNLKKKGEISIYDITNKLTKKLFEFEKYEKGAIKVKTGNNTSVYSFSISSLTPKMILYYRDGNLYFGMSNEYKINISDLDGNEKFHFSLNRRKKKVLSILKDKMVQRLNLPPEIKKLARKNLPDYFNYFEEIYVDDNGFIYTFGPILENKNRLKLDIFSNEGKYIYKSTIEVEQANLIHRVHIAGKKMYLVLLNETGEVKIAKYSIELPK